MPLNNDAIKGILEALSPQAVKEGIAASLKNEAASQVDLKDFQQEADDFTPALIKQLKIHQDLLNATNQDQQAIESSELALRQLLKIRWAYLNQTNGAYFEFPKNPLNIICIQLAKALKKGDESVARILMPTLDENYAYPVDLDELVFDESTGEFRSDLILSEYGKGIILVGSFLDTQKNDLGNWNHEYVNESGIQTVISNEEKELIRTCAGEASEEFFNSYELHERSRRNNKTIENGLRDLCEWMTYWKKGGENERDPSVKVKSSEYSVPEEAFKDPRYKDFIELIWMRLASVDKQVIDKLERDSTSSRLGAILNQLQSISFPDDSDEQVRSDAKKTFSCFQVNSDIIASILGNPESLKAIQQIDAKRMGLNQKDPIDLGQKISKFQERLARQKGNYIPRYKACHQFYEANRERYAQLLRESNLANRPAVKIADLNALFFHESVVRPRNPLVGQSPEDIRALIKMAISGENTRAINLLCTYADLSLFPEDIAFVLYQGKWFDALDSIIQRDAEHTFMNFKKDGQSLLDLCVSNNMAALTLKLVKSGVTLPSLQALINTGWIEVIEAAINSPQSGELVNVLGQSGRAPLHEAARDGNAVITGLLFSIPAINLDLKDKTGHTALYYAINSNSPDIVTELVKKGCQLEHFDGKSLLEISVDRGWATVATVLLDKLKSDMTIDIGRSFLSNALRNNRTEVAIVFLRAFPRLLNERFENQSLMEHGLTKNKQDLVQYLINEGMSYDEDLVMDKAMNSTPPWSGVMNTLITRNTQLISDPSLALFKFAVMNNQPDLVRVLLKNGANIHQSFGQQSILEVAIDYDWSETLIRDILRSKDGIKILTPKVLHYALSLGRLDIFESLIRFMKLESSETERQNAGTRLDHLILIHLLTTKEPTQHILTIVDSLLELSEVESAINEKDSSGLTALDYAIRLGNLELVDKIIKSASFSFSGYDLTKRMFQFIKLGWIDHLDMILKLDKSLVNKKFDYKDREVDDVNISPLTFAILNKRIAMAKLLISSGAEVDDPNIILKIEGQWDPDADNLAQMIFNKMTDDQILLLSNDEGMTALFRAMHFRDFETVKRIIKLNPRLVDGQPKSCQKLLLSAIESDAQIFAYISKLVLDKNPEVLNTPVEHPRGQVHLLYHFSTKCKRNPEDESRITEALIECYKHYNISLPDFITTTLGGKFNLLEFLMLFSEVVEIEAILKKFNPDQFIKMLKSPTESFKITIFSETRHEAQAIRIYMDMVSPSLFRTFDLFDLAILNRCSELANFMINHGAIDGEHSCRPFHRFIRCMNVWLIDVAENLLLHESHRAEPRRHDPGKTYLPILKDQDAMCSLIDAGPLVFIVISNVLNKRKGNPDLDLVYSTSSLNYNSSLPSLLHTAIEYGWLDIIDNILAHEKVLRDHPNSSASSSSSFTNKLSYYWSAARTDNPLENSLLNKYPFSFWGEFFMPSGLLHEAMKAGLYETAVGIIGAGPKVNYNQLVDYLHFFTVGNDSVFGRIPSVAKQMIKNNIIPVEELTSDSKTKLLNLYSALCRRYPSENILTAEASHRFYTALHAQPNSSPSNRK